MDGVEEQWEEERMGGEISEVVKEGSRRDGYVYYLYLVYRIIFSLCSFTCFLSSHLVLHMHFLNQRNKSYWIGDHPHLS